MNTPLAFACLVFTLASYFAIKRLHRRYPRVWLSPIVAVPSLIIGGLLLARIPYATYASLSHWLSWMLGPATIAFAVPIYDFRQTIRRHWLPLVAGVVVGMTVAVVSSVALARLLQLPEILERSLAVRSISTPFAMIAAPKLGGAADLAAVCVVLTGLCGMLIGEWLLALLPLGSPVARGALFGAGAHAIGTAKAYSRSADEGAISCLTMILAGVLMVAVAPLLVRYL